MSSNQPISLHNRQIILNSNARSANQFSHRRNELSHVANYSRKKGILSLKARMLTWESEMDQSRLVINLDTITEKKTAYNDKKQTAMLLISSVENPNGYIFSFDGGKFL
jgi:hypothetical protein